MKACSPKRRWVCIFLVGLLAELALGRPSNSAIADAAPNLNDLPNDLTVPEVTRGEPQPGKRVWVKLPDHAEGDLAHAVYLPVDWKPAERFPVIFEYPGNGRFRNALGDRSDGEMEDCQLGYGLTGGKGMIWVSLPFVDPRTKRHAISWWGDADATADYCKQAVAHTCKQFGGDEKRLVLAGFSRGAIACNYIGLRDSEIAGLWRAMLVHSHYDGVRKWGYAGDDAASARLRLARLGTCPQFISHEQSSSATEKFLREAAPQGKFTFNVLPYPNHSSAWVLKDIPLRQQARAWLLESLRP